MKDGSGIKGRWEEDTGRRGVRKLHLGFNKWGKNENENKIKFFVSGQNTENKCMFTDPSQIRGLY